MLIKRGMFCSLTHYVRKYAWISIDVLQLGNTFVIGYHMGAVVAVNHKTKLYFIYKLKLHIWTSLRIIVFECWKRSFLNNILLWFGKANMVDTKEISAAVAAVYGNNCKLPWKQIVETDYVVRIFTQLACLAICKKSSKAVDRFQLLTNERITDVLELCTWFPRTKWIDITETQVQQFCSFVSTRAKNITDEMNCVVIWFTSS